MKIALMSILLLGTFSAYAEDLEDGGYSSADNTSCSVIVASGRRKVVVSAHCISSGGVLNMNQVSQDNYRYCEREWCYNMSVVNLRAFEFYGTQHGNRIGNTLLYIKD